MAVEKDMINRKTWLEFKESGLLWWINQILHTFGWAIVVEMDNSNEIIGAYPARVKFRGFSVKSNDTGYMNVSKFMKDNAEELFEEATE